MKQDPHTVIGIIKDVVEMETRLFESIKKNMEKLTEEAQKFNELKKKQEQNRQRYFIFFSVLSLLIFCFIVAIYGILSSKL